MDIPASTKPSINYQPLSAEVRHELLLQTRAARPRDEAMWVFGFGSLMWNPCFAFDVQTSAVLQGYDRKFHIWTVRARGTPDNPGLGLCLEDCEGACKGVAFRLSEDKIEEAWESIWEREMSSGVYRPMWLSIDTETHGRVAALTFVVNRNHPHYIGPMAIERMAEIMSGACGQYGPCREYLAGTIAEMRKLNVHDPMLEELLEAVDVREAQVR